ncbi:MAG TPA: phosphatase PAP2 family protein [Gemmatimonadaceae bacterium]|nr:phosphatase PAP2 family protein [Gemmatimonadaceae bacterium]
MTVSRSARDLRPFADWRIVAVSFVLAFAFGAVVALVVRALGDWSVGHPVEQRFLLAVHEWKVPWALDLLLLAVPWLGTNVVLFPLSTLIALYVWRVRRRLDVAVHLMVVQALTLFANWSLKHIFIRERPELFEQVGWFGWASYPSGHSMASISVLGTYAWLLRRERGIGWPMAVVPIVALGNAYGRLYHGVHWPTDVLAGMGVGLIWLVGSAIGFGAAARSRRAVALGRPVPVASEG